MSPFELSVILLISLLVQFFDPDISVKLTGFMCNLYSGHLAEFYTFLKQFVR